MTDQATQAVRRAVAHDGRRGLRLIVTGSKRLPAGSARAFRRDGWLPQTLRTKPLLTGLFLALATPAMAAPPVTGTWLDESQRAGITIAPCGAQLCGTITWLKAPLDAEGHPKHDIHNSDAAKVARPLCGLPMLGGFTPDGPGIWSGGFIYDPEAGKTYSSTIRLQPDGTLRVRGFVGIALFGRSQTWTRPPAPLPQCR